MINVAFFLSSIGVDQQSYGQNDVEETTLIWNDFVKNGLFFFFAGFFIGLLPENFWFEVCSLHGFEKSVLVTTSKDSSAWELESEIGNILNTVAVHPKQSSKDLFI